MPEVPSAPMYAPIMDRKALALWRILAQMSGFEAVVTGGKWPQMVSGPPSAFPLSDRAFIPIE